MQQVVQFIKTLPYYYRDIQPSFTSSLDAHKAFMESRGCEAPNYVLGFWYITPEQVCLASRVQIQFTQSGPTFSSRQLTHNYTSLSLSLSLSLLLSPSLHATRAFESHLISARG